MTLKKEPMNGSNLGCTKPQSLLGMTKHTYNRLSWGRLELSKFVYISIACRAILGALIQHFQLHIHAIDLPLAIKLRLQIHKSSVIYREQTKA